MIKVYYKIRKVDLDSFAVTATKHNGKVYFDDDYIDLSVIFEDEKCYNKFIEERKKQNAK